MNLKTFDFVGEDIVFLLGAGASVDAGIPSLGQLMEKIESVLRVDIEKAKDENERNIANTISEVYYYFKKNSISHNDLKTNDIKFGSYNIENIISNIRNVVDEKHSPYKSTYTSIDRTLLEIIKNDHEILKEVRDKLTNLIVKEITDNTNKCYDKIEYLYYLFFITEELNQSINVFSLNFDLVFEFAAEKHSSVFKSKNNKIETGFGESKNINQNDRIFNPANFMFNKDAKTIYYHKIHGSLNWIKSQNGLDVKQIDINSIKNPNEIIFGTSDKYRSESPYIFLYGNFVAKIRNAKLLIVLGYSYNDAHINDAIKNALHFNTSLKILNIAPNLKDNTRLWLDENSTHTTRLPNLTKEELIKKLKDNNYTESLMSNKQYYDINYSLKSFLYLKSFDEKAIYLCKIYNYYLNQQENKYLLDDIGYWKLKKDAKKKISNQILALGKIVDKEIFSGDIENKFKIFRKLYITDKDGTNIDILLNRLKNLKIILHEIILVVSQFEISDILCLTD